MHVTIGPRLLLCHLGSEKGAMAAWIEMDTDSLNMAMILYIIKAG